MTWTVISLNGCLKWPLLARRRAARTVAVHSAGVNANANANGQQENQAAGTGGPPFCHTCK